MGIVCNVCLCESEHESWYDGGHTLPPPSFSPTHTYPLSVGVINQKQLHIALSRLSLASLSLSRVFVLHCFIIELLCSHSACLPSMSIVLLCGSGGVLACLLACRVCVSLCRSVGYSIALALVASLLVCVCVCPQIVYTWRFIVPFHLEWSISNLNCYRSIFFRFSLSLNIARVRSDAS